MRTMLRIAGAAIVIMWSTSVWAIPIEPPPNNPNLAGNCGIARPDEIGCNVGACEACVCDRDPFCCGIVAGDSAALIDGDFCSDETCWDPACVGEAGNECATACRESSLYAPALSPWGLGLAALLLVGIAYQTLRRSRPSRA